MENPERKTRFGMLKVLYLYAELNDIVCILFIVTLFTTYCSYLKKMVKFKYKEMENVDYRQTFINLFR